jgi:hypothetical protein
VGAWLAEAGSEEGRELTLASAPKKAAKPSLAKDASAPSAWARRSWKGFRVCQIKK